MTSIKEFKKRWEKRINDIKKEALNPQENSKIILAYRADFASMMTYQKNHSKEPFLPHFTDLFSELRVALSIANTRYEKEHPRKAWWDWLRNVPLLGWLVEQIIRLITKT